MDKSLSVSGKRRKNLKHTTETGYAKINLYLNIVGKRNDGYHLLDGVMQSVSLGDEIDVAWEEPTEGKTEILLSVEGNSNVPTDASNLAVRAARAFLSATGESGTVTVRIRKKIPMAAGLAGGSTDAAATLRALNRLSQKPLSVRDLCALGAKLGADVPFCIRGGAMRTQGIGEILTPTAGLRERFLVVACAGEGISTPDAYRRLDEMYGNFAKPVSTVPSLQKLTDTLQNARFEEACKEMFNLFEDVVAAERPFVGRIRSVLTDHGAEAARMSGSGPSVFGVFREEGTAHRACEALAQAGIPAYFCTPFNTELC